MKRWTLEALNERLTNGERVIRYERGYVIACWNERTREWEVAGRDSGWGFASSPEGAAAACCWDGRPGPETYRTLREVVEELARAGLCESCDGTPEAEEARPSMTDPIRAQLARLYDACDRNMSELSRLLTRHAPATTSGKRRAVYRATLYEWMDGSVIPTETTRDAWLDAAIAAALEEVAPVSPRGRAAADPTPPPQPAPRAPRE